MSAIVLYFHVHQPYRLKRYEMFSIGKDRNYFGDSKLERLDNSRVLRKVAEKCYLPTNKLLLDLIKKNDGFKVSFSISGSLLDQLEEFAPEVIDSFEKLVDTRNVELVAETYYHSLAFMYSQREFEEQVGMHRKKLMDLFGVEPRSFRNTELIYNNDVAKEAEKMGFEAIIAEGVEKYLSWRSPNFVYKPKGARKIKLLLKNYKLSDDIAFRFSNREWEEWPLTADKFTSWLDAALVKGQVINLFMDYETFGEHQWGDSGIFDFLANLPEQVRKRREIEFLTVGEAAHAFDVAGEVDMPELTSWADLERDLSAWLSNPMQLSAAKAVFDLEKKVLASKNKKLIRDWRRLTTSDHFYYMSTKTLSDGEVHSYFSPNESPYEAFNNFMNVIRDMKQRVGVA